MDPSMEGLKALCAAAFGKTDIFWYQDYKLWCGSCIYVLFWSKWLLREYTGYLFHEKALFVWGMDLVHLHLVQYHDCGFQTITIITSLNTLFCAVAFYRRPVVKDTGNHLLRSTSVYNELGTSFLQVCFVFMGQTMFGAFYYWSLWHNFNLSSVEELYWLAGYICVQMTQYYNRGHRSALGDPWQLADLHVICEHPGTVQVSQKNFKGDVITYTVPKWNLYVRNIMGVVVKLFLRELVGYSVPLMLTQHHDPMNCVIYSIAVNFIVTLDNQDHVDHQISFVELADGCPLDDRGAYLVPKRAEEVRKTPLVEGAA
eukprot:TRINITY_DN36093_c0_g1_i1.p1 TRINITY_DN36093_c0_g1~~TRINITY_DN36093_c0_g1_i1.p1  ORF type:complete len:314 (-),score=34.41 TRINITY_DN36093_c0_g1_i1:275-1216(-)